MDGIEATPAPDLVETGSAETATDVTPDSGASVDQESSFTDLTPTPEDGQEVTLEWLQERHKQMQADYTRKRQADAEAAKARAEELQFLDGLRSDPEVQRAVFEQLQELLSEEEMEDLEEALGDEGTNESELERTVREMREREQQREMESLSRSIMSHVDSLAKEAGVDLDDADTAEIFRAATAGEIGNEATAQAFAQWHAREQAKQQKYLKAYLASKQAPTQVPAGQSATEKVDLSKSENRIARMAAIIGGGAS